MEDPLSRIIARAKRRIAADLQSLPTGDVIPYKTSLHYYLTGSAPAQPKPDRRRPRPDPNAPA